jgi:hypothetical protein
MNVRRKLPSWTRISPLVRLEDLRGSYSICSFTTHQMENRRRFASIKCHMAASLSAANTKISYGQVVRALCSATDTIIST